MFLHKRSLTKCLINFFDIGKSHNFKVFSGVSQFQFSCLPLLFCQLFLFPLSFISRLALLKSMSIILNLPVIHNFVADMLVDDILVILKVIFKYFLLHLSLHNIIGGKNFSCGYRFEPFLRNLKDAAGFFLMGV